MAQLKRLVATWRDHGARSQIPPDASRKMKFRVRRAFQMPEHQSHESGEHNAECYFIGSMTLRSPASLRRGQDKRSAQKRHRGAIEGRQGMNTRLGHRYLSADKMQADRCLSSGHR